MLSWDRLYGSSTEDRHNIKGHLSSRPRKSVGGCRFSCDVPDCDAGDGEEVLSPLRERDVWGGPTARRRIDDAVEIESRKATAANRSKGFHGGACAEFAWPRDGRVGLATGEQPRCQACGHGLASHGGGMTGLEAGEQRLNWILAASQGRDSGLAPPGKTGPPPLPPRRQFGAV